MPIATIGAYGIEESASEAMTSFVHTAPDFPSSPLIISGTLLHALIWPEMDSNERLRAMEEELTVNWMKTEGIELALKAIMNKLEVSVSEEPAMEEEFSFRRNSGTPAFSETHTPSHVKIKPATPVDFDGDCEKGRAFLNSCNIYTLQSVVTFSPTGRLRFTEHYHSSKPTGPPAFQTRCSR